MFYNKTNYDINNEEWKKILTTKSENTRNYWKVATFQNFVWDKNDFYVIHLAKRDNKGCVPNLHIKILPFPIILSQNTFTTMHIIQRWKPAFKLVNNGRIFAAYNCSSYTWELWLLIRCIWYYDSIYNIPIIWETQTRQSNN